MQTDELIILHEDNHVIVVLKPQGVPCCPDESGDDNLFDCVKRYIKEKYNKPGNVFLGLVHRLDRPTGGVMVFAKTDKAASRLCDGLRNGKFEKHYFAVLAAIPSKKEATLENYLRQNSVTNMVYVCTQTEQNAKDASLDYKIIAEKSTIALADINLHTGRKHQIRVQMASINCPVYGDMRYGGAKAVKGRLGLWAYYLSFPHPVTQERLKFFVAPPTESSPWSYFADRIDPFIAACR